MCDESEKNKKKSEELLYKDTKVLIDMLVPLVNSYRLLVGAAHEFNSVSLVHKHDIEEAIDRADDLGDIIDDVQGQLKEVMKLYLKQMNSNISLNEFKDLLQISNKDCISQSIRDTTTTAKERKEPSGGRDD